MASSPPPPVPFGYKRVLRCQQCGTANDDRWPTCNYVDFACGHCDARNTLQRQIEPASMVMRSVERLGWGDRILLIVLGGAIGLAVGGFKGALLGASMALLVSIAPKSQLRPE